MSPLALFAGPMGMVYKWLIFAALAAAAMAWAYMQGVERESDRRDAEQLEVEREEREHHARAVAFGTEQARKAQAADIKAEDYQQRWKEARNAAKRSGAPLGVADCPTTSANPAPAGSGIPRHDPGIRLRLTWEFVGLFDAAYSDSAGQPLFGDTARAEKAAAGSGAAAPYTLDDLIDTHGENAKRWDACRRQLRSLVETIDGLERRWNEQHAH